MTEIAFGLGSNLGNRLAHLSFAREELLRFEESSLLAASPVYETSPVDVAPENQGFHFLNAVLVLTSTASAEDWLGRIAEIETAAGRELERNLNAPRPLDIDLLYWGDRSCATPSLTLPHPRLHQRRFVLQPLSDVRPNRILPGQQEAVQQLLASLKSDEVIEQLENPW